MPSERSLLDVYAYDDYRAFLRDTYEEGKRTRRMSYRGFSRRAKLSSPNYLKLVIEGKRNLTLKTAERFADALHLDGAEREYFCLLVEREQSEDDKRVKALTRQIAAARTVHRTRRLEAAHAAYCSRWYLPAIRELVACKDFREEPEWISRKLRPPVRTEEVQEAMALLLELGLITRNASGRLEQTTPIVSTGAQATEVYVASYHRMMLLRAAASIDGFSAEERDISSLTLTVGAKKLKELKERIREFRRELLELSAADRNPRRVVQINIQLFPLSED